MTNTHNCIDGSSFVHAGRKRTAPRPSAVVSFKKQNMKFSIHFQSFVLISLYHHDFATSHSYLTEPKSRSNQAQTQTGCRGPACLGPCELPRAKAGEITPFHPVKRGDSLELFWPRNNHAGGFIRIAWAPLNDSDSHEAFDQHVQQINCHENGCKSSNPADPLGGDTDGGSPGKCTTTIKVPSQLTDGEWTMQWAWFGGAFQLGDYYSCADFKVQGGEQVATSQKLTPEFKGGDAHFPNQNKCLFFNTNRLHACVNEPCQNGPQPGKNEGLPFGFDGSAAQNASTQQPGPAAPKHEHSSPSAISSTKSVSTSVSASPTPTSSSSSPSQTSAATGTSPFTFSAQKDDITAEYVQSFTDEQRQKFGGILRVINTGNTPIEQWRITLGFPFNYTVTEVSGASFQSLNDGKVRIESSRALDDEQQIMITGSF